MMRCTFPVLLAGTLSLAGQSSVNPTPAWRSSLSALPAKPSANTNEVLQFEKEMRMAAAYLATTQQLNNSQGNSSAHNSAAATSAQWQANRDLVRRMAVYLYALQTLSGDAKFRGAVTHAQRSFDSLGFGPYLAYSQVAQSSYPDADQTNTQPQTQPARQVLPPFDLNAPEIGDVSDPDKDVAAALRSRYETDAAHSAGVWENAENLRQNLELRGLGLNVETATAMIRLPQQFRSAAASLRNGDWDGARTHLEMAESVTEKIAKTVGR